MTQAFHGNQWHHRKATAALRAMGLLMLPVADEQRLPFDVKDPTSAAIGAMKELEEGKGQRFETPSGLCSDLDI